MRRLMTLVLVLGLLCLGRPMAAQAQQYRNFFPNPANSLDMSYGTTGTTVSHVFDIKATWGSNNASNNILCSNFVLKANP